MEALVIMSMSERAREGEQPTERDLLFAALEAIAALAKELTGKTMVVGLGDPATGDYIKTVFAQTSVEWREDS